MIRELIALENDAKVWIYQSSRPLTDEEVVDARRHLHHFMEQWTSHNNELMTYGNIFHHRFLALFVDETLAGASGCSIDKSVEFVRQLGAHLEVDFFDRMTYTYLILDEENGEEIKHVKQVHHTEINDAYRNGQINDDTLFFDHLVKNKAQFLDAWIKPLKDSWHKRFIK